MQTGSVRRVPAVSSMSIAPTAIAEDDKNSSRADIAEIKNVGILAAPLRKSESKSQESKLFRSIEQEYCAGEQEYEESGEKQTQLQAQVDTGMHEVHKVASSDWDDCGRALCSASDSEKVNGATLQGPFTGACKETVEDFEDRSNSKIGTEKDSGDGSGIYVKDGVTYASL